jgi:glycosyltransferase involved in cell wall biosynthesis
MTDVLQAVRAAGLPVMAIGESDAQLSPLYHSWPTFRFMTYLQPTLRGKLGAAKYWFQRFLFQTSNEHRALVENTEASDVLALASEGAVDEFRHLIRRIGAPELACRVAWVPYPVPQSFCAGIVKPDRADRVIAVGRWDSPQKNPELLARTIRQLHAAGNRTEILIAGKGTVEHFAAVGRECRQVHLVGVQPRERIRELMAGCRAVLISSRWESGPIVANEMLSLGGTVVGTPIPTIRGIVADGRFGRVSRSHASRSLTDAVLAEMAAWHCGERDPAAIAAHWRPLVSPSRVAQRMLDLLALPVMANDAYSGHSL